MLKARQDNAIGAEQMIASVTYSTAVYSPRQVQHYEQEDYDGEQTLRLFYAKNLHLEKRDYVFILQRILHWQFDVVLQTLEAEAVAKFDC